LAKVFSSKELASMPDVFQNLPPVLRMAVPGILVLGLVIFVHELGHFIAAKLVKVRVLAFSLGFGKRVIGFRRGGTDYRISLFPLGGYVQMAGDSPGEDGGMPAGPEQFLSHPWPGRAFIAVAGPLANLITAFVTLVVVAGVTGISMVDFPNVVGTLPDTSAAYRAGLREGDRIVALNGERTPSWVSVFQTNERQPRERATTLTLERGGAPLELVLDPERREPVLVGLTPVQDPPVVGMVVAGMPAYKAGLREGDRITKVDGRPIRVWAELPEALRGQVDRAVTLEVERGGQAFEVRVTPISDGSGGDRGLIGIEAPRHEVYVHRYGPFEALQFGFWATGQVVANVYGGLWMTIARPLYYREYMGGPLFIAQAASQQARRGLDALLQFFATINVAIMAFNLLPLPVLDGGHILLALLEALRRRALSARAYLRFQRAGLIVLGTLFFIILANDPLRLLQRQRALDRGPQPVPEERAVAPSSP
jgi:regulator of sigma E protease